MVVLDDVIEIAMGVLNPLFPVGFAVILAFAISPWYMGIFWASVVFKVLGIPQALIKVFMPGRVAMEALARAGRQ